MQNLERQKGFNMGIARILLMFFITIMMATLVVWERNKIVEIGYQVAKLQKDCAELSEKSRKMNYHVSRLLSPDIIAYKIQILKLPLIPQGDLPAILVARQVNRERNATGLIKTSLAEDLYTQKVPLLNCCSLHN